MKKFLIGLFLFLVSMALVVPFAMWGLVETAISIFYKKKFKKSIAVFGDFALLLAVLVDVTINVFMQVPFNRILITEDGYKFGSRKDTISGALGVNEREGTLTKTGKALCNILNWLEEDHCLKSISE